MFMVRISHYPMNRSTSHLRLPSLLSPLSNKQVDCSIEGKCEGFVEFEYHCAHASESADFVSGRSKQTRKHVCNELTLVWGSLSLIIIINFATTGINCLHSPSTEGL